MSIMLLNDRRALVLEQFLEGFDSKKYGREIAKNLKISQKTISNILNELEKCHILKYSTEGKNKYYFLNKSNLQLKEIIKLVEINKKIRFLEKNAKLKELFAQLEIRSNGMCLIFGSYASGKQHAKSDLDIFVIGNIINVKDLEELYGIKINIVKSERKKFDKKEVFIKEIIKNHIILKGVEDYIVLVW
ncbi:hypothetical protein COU54_00245 [Candidatus Pacearchaeota archaeon CG10_big_fil_rev_8_21_14_0_10_31_24]|nr:MAG: hypothetical protein COU54_00245 [Candidatus Pacearchaeota archaeon CG10_big_fil_rev_8_21_14_0_10_31_24]